MPASAIDRSGTEDILDRACALAEALRQAHQAGDFFGSLTPGQIEWVRDGVRLSKSPTAELTAYSAPEQILGEAADSRTDIFAFGLILYEMLAGRRAFDANEAGELKRQILETEPAPLDGIPSEAGRVIGRCLRKRPRERWQRMAPVLIELKLALAGSRQTRQAAEWVRTISSLRTQLAGQSGKLEEQAGRQAKQIAASDGTVAALRDSIKALQQVTQVHTRAIESLEAATVQTDEALEHVVEAFGDMRKSMVERDEAQTVPIAAGAN